MKDICENSIDKYDITTSEEVVMGRGGILPTSDVNVGDTNNVYNM